MLRIHYFTVLATIQYTIEIVCLILTDYELLSCKKYVILADSELLLAESGVLSHNKYPILADSELTLAVSEMISP